MSFEPSIALQIAVLAITGINALQHLKTRSIVNELRAFMFEKFISKDDFDRHFHRKENQ